MDCSPPGSSVHGIFQARVLEWGAIAFSKVVSDSATPWSVVCQDYTTTKSSKVLMHAATWMDRKGIMLVEISQSQKTTDFMILSTTPCHLPRALIIYLCVCKSLSRFQLFVTPSTVARQAPLSMGFSRQEYWNGFPHSPPRNRPNPGIKPRSLTLQEDSLPTGPPRKYLSLI